MNIEYSFNKVTEMHEASLIYGDAELAIDFKAKNPHAIGDYQYAIEKAEVYLNGSPMIQSKTKESYLMRKEDLLKQTVKEYLS
jgi:hypothetical protein